MEGLGDCPGLKEHSSGMGDKTVRLNSNTEKNVTRAARRCKHANMAEGVAPGWMGCRDQCCPHRTSKEGQGPNRQSLARMAENVLSEMQVQGHKGCHSWVTTCQVPCSHNPA